MVLLFAPDGVGEIDPTTDLVAEIAAAVAADEHGPLSPGDIVVVTSKIVSKAENRYVPASDRDDVIAAETRMVVAQRGAMRIVRTAAGLTLAAAGVDTSNVDPGRVLLLPSDPDGSAARLAAGLGSVAGGPVGVVVSDTAGRPWRIGQTDHAIGASGVRVLESYAGRIDGYGNELSVTTVALADELAAAADLVKAKLAGRPVAVVRGLAHLVDPSPGATGATAGATALIRTGRDDLFSHGSREAVLAALCRALRVPTAYDDLVGLDPATAAAALLERGTLPDDPADLVRRLLQTARHLAEPDDPGADAPPG
jgi:coenzyme F420-0:L-glutamate ligase/coenzyme F420-1:gamma-L-glutamate ligase